MIHGSAFLIIVSDHKRKHISAEFRSTGDAEKNEERACFLMAFICLSGDQEEQNRLDCSMSDPLPSSFISFSFPDLVSCPFLSLSE